MHSKNKIKIEFPLSNGEQDITEDRERFLRSHTDMDLVISRFCNIGQVIQLCRLSLLSFIKLG